MATDKKTVPVWDYGDQKKIAELFQKILFTGETPALSYSDLFTGYAKKSFKEAIEKDYKELRFQPIDITTEETRMSYHCERCDADPFNTTLKYTVLQVNIPALCYSGSIPFYLCPECRILLLDMLNRWLPDLERYGFELQGERAALEGGNGNRMAHQHACETYTNLITKLHAEFIDWIKTGRRDAAEAREKEETTRREQNEAASSPTS